MVSLLTNPSASAYFNFLGLSTSEHVVRDRGPSLGCLTSTDASGEDVAHPKGEGERKKRKSSRKTTGRPTTGEEYSLPQGPFGCRCKREGDEATANNDPLA